MEEVRGGPAGSLEDLKVIRVEAGVLTARFCRRFDRPDRTWRRCQAKVRTSTSAKGPRTRPARTVRARLFASRR